MVGSQSVEDLRCIEGHIWHLWIMIEKLHPQRQMKELAGGYLCPISNLSGYICLILGPQILPLKVVAVTWAYDSKPVT